VLLELWEIYAERRPEDIGSVLDFGCACGRVMRWFSLALPEAECLGADVRAASIDWCNANLRGRYLANGVRPPLDLPDDSVELVVSLSIFSHLNRASNLAWFRELVRVTKPGGLLLLSTHGAFAMAVVMRSPEKQQIFCTTRDEALAGLRALSREHFVFRPLPLETVRGLDGPEDAYGQTFFTEAFVRAEWEPLAEVVGYVPVSLNLLQDFFVLRKRG
jgi:SAM-dependent methyltransferase